MKLISSVFLLVSSVAALSLEGLYEYQSSAKNSEGIEKVVTAQVVVSKVSGTKDQYSLIVKDIEIEELEVKLPSLPFHFQTKDGQIISVKTDPRETLYSKNFKKAIAESLQTSTLDNSHRISQFGASGIRDVTYESAIFGNKKEIYSSYTRDDFTSFPPGSNIEQTDTSIYGMKTTVVDLEKDAISNANSKVDLQFFKGNKPIVVTSESSILLIENTYSEVEPSENLVEETLIHEINFEQQESRLSVIVGNPSEYIEKLLSVGVSKRDSLKMESKLLTLANLNQNYANLIIEALEAMIKSGSSDKRLFFIIARINSPLVDSILAEKLEIAVNSKDNELTYAILLSINQMKSIKPDSPVFKALNSFNFDEGVKGMAELTIGSLCKLLTEEDSSKILSQFESELENASDLRKVHLLHVLGNARQNSPKEFVSNYLRHTEENVRATALFSLRGSMENEEVQKVITSSLSSRPITESKKSLANLLKAIKENERSNKRSSYDHLDEFLETLKEHQVVQELPDSARKIFHERISLRQRKNDPIKITSSTSIWNDSSDPLYNFVAPLKVRQDDVKKYPSYEAFINAEMHGPKLSNLKFITGVFSGQGSPGCLAGNFKIFNHLYTETSFLGKSRLLADLELYVLTYDITFDSRIYGNINGNVIVDLKITSNCSDGKVPIYHGEIDLVDYYAEFPIELGTVDVTARAIASLDFDVGYKVCILSLNPYVELRLTGKVELVGDAEVLISVIGLLRAGIDADSYLNYEIGPETQIGTRKNGTCEACVGIYYGYDKQYFDVELWHQRREGLGWGDPIVIPVYSWSEPPVPFPTTIVETCSDI